MKPVRSPRRTIKLPRVTQQSESHCGPAVLELLYAHLNKKFTQNQIAAAAQVSKKIDKDGTRPKELAKAVTKLTPQYKFWFKQYATVEDVDKLINIHDWPVAVNWQGLFYDSPEEEKADKGSDHGHYSVVSQINLKKNHIHITDPFPDYSAKPRKFALDWFVGRWWDEVEDRNTRSKKIELISTKQLIFIIAPAKAQFPAELSMMPASKIDMLKHIKTENEFFRRLTSQLARPFRHVLNLNS